MATVVWTAFFPWALFRWLAWLLGRILNGGGLGGHGLIRSHCDPVWFGECEERGEE